MNRSRAAGAPQMRSRHGPLDPRMTAGCAVKKGSTETVLPEQRMGCWRRSGGRKWCARRGGIQEYEGKIKKQPVPIMS